MKKKKIIIIVIIIIFLTLIYFISSAKAFNIQDDFIFFKLFGQSQTKDSNFSSVQSLENVQEEKNIYIFKVSYKKTILKSVNLVKTIDKKTLIKEKIAPGTEGNFKIIITSNENLEYQVIFKSQNEKPENLVFYINGENKEFKSLEDLQENLKGEIKAKEEKIIDINWKWKYESSRNGDKQDTEDGIKITKYNFDIYTIGNL